ncbi:hypothetical protein PABG_07032 [Paracoccidioides brasiliensis Pb03]|uniref:Uncharacterized protein n=1 Tax=Paracoccidioides brasiliensis (strain Pb18) TaxID=502780 RepID=C1GGP8_PARBD|nr:uncharacterized protein PADG_06485 [Paracoccidioides brasiliensis Pb18]EEH16945.1 hypothetical protein PABG_07032 [Paracoccidioides brasiliensis Pb03]EEH50406.2 hypothetical protein PADG_06485 [Paracoccidioides brasiliensis Pb18]ODH45811.1 hypothetical protein GX48_08097 [Paracoccidioides brasiliensis]
MSNRWVGVSDIFRVEIVFELETKSYIASVMVDIPELYDMHGSDCSHHFLFLLYDTMFKI